jgi:hypothetical protein
MAAFCDQTSIDGTLDIVRDEIFILPFAWWEQLGMDHRTRLRYNPDQLYRR